MNTSVGGETERLRIGVIDTGVNPWHSHVGGPIRGIRIYVDAEGKIEEDDDYRDLIGHGTAVAGILRQGLPQAEIFALRVFDEELSSYPSLVARALLRAVAEGCGIINLSLAMAPGPGEEILTEACRAVSEAGAVLVAAGHPSRPGLLPASLPGVVGVVAGENLKPGEMSVHPERPYSHLASGWPRDLDGVEPEANLWGHSFACARVTLDLARRMEAETARTSAHENP